MTERFFQEGGATIREGALIRRNTVVLILVVVLTYNPAADHLAPSQNIYLHLNNFSETLRLYCNSYSDLDNLKSRIIFNPLQNFILLDKFKLKELANEKFNLAQMQQFSCSIQKLTSEK